MIKTEKVSIVKELTEELKSATSTVLVDYKGLSVSAQQELKKRLKSVGANMKVVKNTLLKLAGKDAKLPEDALTDTVLSGPTALVMTEDDPIAPLQVLYKFAKEFEIPELKVGIIEKDFQDKVTLEILAQLPSKDVLVSQAVGTIAQPLYGIVGVLNANLQKLLYILKTKAEQS